MKINDLKRMIKRFRYFAYFSIFLFGTILILCACTVLEEGDFYDLCMGIGCSVIATVIVTVILLVLMPDESEERKELEKWGLVKIYDERNDIKIESKHFPKKKLDFIAFGLSHFREANRKTDFIIQRLVNGLNIRIITLNPNSIFVKEQEKLENNSDIGKNIVDLIEWVDKINRKLEKKVEKGEKYLKGKISIKLYNSLPLDFFCQTDDTIFIGSYMPDISSGKNITYQFNLRSKGGEYYSEFFEKIWVEDSIINIVNSYEDYFFVNQRKSVETVLKYFSDLYKCSSNLQVIGVVAIFKDSLRRTFFSCNKPHEERHVCHKKDSGSVGKLVQLNSGQSLKKILLFNDYNNKLTFIQTYQNRNQYIKKIENTVQRFKDDDTVGILAVPLFKNEVFIGALTFDFAEFPVEYNNIIDTLKKLENKKNLKGDPYAVLKELFDIANSCKNMITNLLGQDMETVYKELYEEEWRYDDK